MFLLILLVYFNICINICMRTLVPVSHHGPIQHNLRDKPSIPIILPTQQSFARKKLQHNLYPRTSLAGFSAGRSQLQESVVQSGDLRDGCSQPCNTSTCVMPNIMALCAPVSSTNKPVILWDLTEVRVWLMHWRRPARCVAGDQRGWSTVIQTSPDVQTYPHLHSHMNRSVHTCRLHPTRIRNRVTHI